MVELPGMDEMMNRRYSCDWGTLYDVVTCSLKNKLLIKIKIKIKIIKSCRRSFLVNKLERIRGSFGGDSEQAADCVRDLNEFDDNELKLRASKYKEFLLINNEKPTKAFCLLGKENNLLDDRSQIKDDNGRIFVGKKERGEYVREFYENLYKKNWIIFLK